MEWQDDEQRRWVYAAQAGDLAAFDRLAARFRPLAFLVARRMLDRDPAEDVVQESLLTAYKALPQLKNPDLFGPWLSAIVRHRASRVLAGKERTEEPLSDHVDRLILRAAPSIAAAEFESEAMVALAALDEGTREVAQLYYEHEWKVAQIAHHLGLSAATVKWRLHEARTRLRQKLCPTPS